MSLPVVKLGTLLLKTVSKPIASRLKKQAGVNPRFRELIVNFAQVNHRITTTIQRRIYSHSTDVAIHPLDEEKAVQASADLIGEIFVFSVAWVALIFEVQRSARSEARKEEIRRQELEAMKQKEDDLARELEEFRRKISELEHLLKGRGLLGLFTNKHGEENKSGTRA